ncbi:asparagine synthetase domain-containing protein CG17486 isoform X2 [Athalia rosae]|uniref:asparagine synthetase domain-containing protein CG17486 isoform X2 n=1 Tax=Athalia rosae TaxID=37344 RepID=UPI000625F598|nr:asparagine synthetase domain-containing protein CG17486 isoform X2 [Athalia rosae]
MCGIFCYVCRAKNYQVSGTTDSRSEEWEKCKDATNARGPDGVTDITQQLTKEWNGHFAASVLWMQGSRLVLQPCVDVNGNILLWNGDIFNGNLASDKDCDTLTVLRNFNSSQNVIATLLKIQGPYSFIYFDNLNNRLYFGRDPFGRHSLLIKLSDDKDSLTLCSVGNKNMTNVVEVPAIGIFICDLNSEELNLACYPWKEPNLRFTDIIEELEANLNMDIDVRETIVQPEINLSLHLDPEIKDLEYLNNIDCNQSFNAIMQQLLDNDKVHRRVENILRLLKNSVEVRVKKKPNYCRNCVRLHLSGEQVNCKHAKIGILFSGGLDSALLAVLADQFVPENEEIDLLNVAFEKIVNPNLNGTKEIEPVNYDVPDRKTGRQTYAELERICPNRKWNFIEVNVTQLELRKYRSSHICNLVYPRRTILDDSLGCAVWFASKAKGILTPTGHPYESSSRILLLGMGADELFGGYMRHRTTLKHKGWGTLTQELKVELERISERNLGRDDRIVSDHGRQSRLPYLDENLVTYVQSLKPWERCYPTDQMPVGLGDKLLLRLVARRLGLQSTANFPKRAFQFGSRIANSKENAKDISERL